MGKLAIVHLVLLLAGFAIGSVESKASVVFIDDYQVASDTYADDACEFAAAAAGMDGTVLLAPGQTYEFRNVCIINNVEGLTITTDGWPPATIKRAPERRTVITNVGGILEGANSITVRDPGLFNVGDRMTIVQVGCDIAPDTCGYGDGEIVLTRVINKVGDVLTFWPKASRSYAENSQVISNHSLFEVMGTSHHVRFANVRFEGNQADNPTYRYWGNQQEIYLIGVNNSLLTNLTFNDSLGNSVYVGGGSNTTIENCTFIEPDIAAIHLSGTSNVAFLNNTIDGACSEWARSNHCNGAFEISLGNSNITVTGNTIKNSTKAGIGAFNTGTPHGNIGLIVTNNRFEDNDEVLSGWAGAKTAGSAQLLFNDNIAINSGEFRLKGNRSAGYITDIEVGRNTFVDSYMTLEYIGKPTLPGNEIVRDNFFWYSQSYTGPLPMLEHTSEGIGFLAIGNIEDELVPDEDDDGIADDSDLCPGIDNAEDNTDTNGDGIGDACQCGDVNLDGTLDNADSILIMRAYRGLSTGSAYDPALCDVNGDGLCNNVDSNLIKRYDLGRPVGSAFRTMCAPMLY